MLLCFAGVAGKGDPIKYPLPVINLFKNSFHHSVEDLLACNTIPKDWGRKVTDFSQLISRTAKRLADQVKNSPKKDWNSLTQPLCLELKDGTYWLHYFVLVGNDCWKGKTEVNEASAKTQFDLDVCASIRAM